MCPCNVVSHNFSYRISLLKLTFCAPYSYRQKCVRAWIGRHEDIPVLYNTSTFNRGMIHEVWKTTKRVGMQKAHKKVRDTCKKRRCHRHARDVALSLSSCCESISAALTFSWSKRWSSRFQSENERASKCLMFLHTRGKYD